MVFHHSELQLKSRTSQQWTLPLGFKNKVAEVPQVYNVVTIFLSLPSSLKDKQCGAIMSCSAAVYLGLMTVEKHASAEKNTASLFSYNVGHLFFVVATKQFLV